MQYCRKSGKQRILTWYQNFCEWWHVPKGQHFLRFLRSLNEKLIETLYSLQKPQVMNNSQLIETMLLLKICLAITTPVRYLLTGILRSWSITFHFDIIKIIQSQGLTVYLLTYKTTALFVLFCTKLLSRPTKRNNFTCTKMLMSMKCCILCIKGLSPNFASYIKQSFKGIYQ